MPFRVIHDTSLNCILATVEGDLDRPAASGFFTEVLRVASERLRPRPERPAQRHHQGLHRRAIVVARDRDDYDFWETVCSNLGQGTVRVFEDYEEAKRWAVLDAEPESEER